MQPPLYNLDKFTKPQRTLRECPAQFTPSTRLRQSGAATLSTVELLAVLIGKGLPDQSATQLAEQVLAHFGSLIQLCRATVDDLAALPGIGLATADKIIAALELTRRTFAAETESLTVRHAADIANLLIAEMGILDHEQLRVVILNTKHHLMRIETVYQGSVYAASVRVGELFRTAVKLRATAICVVHNHPSGDPTPSPEDVRLTELIIDAGKLLDIDLLDHVIIGRQRFVSLRERGLAFK